MTDNNVTPIKPTAESIKAAAMAEVSKDLADAAKRRLVEKYRQIATAKKVLANLEGEARTLEADIAEELGS